MEEDIKSSAFSLSEREGVAIFIAQRSMTSYESPINQTQKAVESISPTKCPQIYVNSPMDFKIY